jgi:hypothetical protein
VSQTAVLVITVLLVVGLLAFRIYRAAREQRWSITGMWVVPGIFLLVFAYLLTIDFASSVWVVPAAIVGLAVGLGIGLYQGTHTTVRADHAAKVVYIKVSPIGNVIFFGVLALRVGMRFLFVPTSAFNNPHAGQTFVVPAEAAIISSALLALAFGMILGHRIYVQRVYNAQAVSPS